MTLILAVLLATAMALPHAVTLDRARPAIAATIWGCALAVRAACVLFAVAYLVLFLPATAVFATFTHWCWHAVLPLLATHLGLDGHRVGDAATILPAFLLAVSLVSVMFGLARATRSVRLWLVRSALGVGPRNAVIVGGAEVVLAAAGLARPRVVVSAGALAALDDEELAAGLDHEHGHIARRHRFVLVFAELCRAVARVLPGTSRAVRELRFQLERDADRWALSKRNDPFALASAICKAATVRAEPGLACAGLGDGRASRRVDELMALETRPCGRLSTRALGAGAAAMVALNVALWVALPPTIAVGAQQLASVEQPRHCP
jgi:Zn-dependent protease with chaperone function